MRAPKERSDSQLVATFKAAMHIWDGQKADGVPLVERLRGLEQTLRQAWPFTREWKFLCPNCDDVGLAIIECLGDAQCGRTNPHLLHSYGQPCWCALGKRFQEKRRPEPEDMLAAAAKVRKPTKVGR